MAEIIDGKVVMNCSPVTDYDRLTASAEKWQVIADYLRQNGGAVRTGATDTCPLCWEYGYNYNCAGCPVQQETGWSSCRKTPWAIATMGGVVCHCKDPEAAQREADFLLAIRDNKPIYQCPWCRAYWAGNHCPECDV